MDAHRLRLGLEPRALLRLGRSAAALASRTRSGTTRLSGCRASPRAHRARTTNREQRPSRVARSQRGTRGSTVRATSHVEAPPRLGRAGARSLVALGQMLPCSEHGTRWGWLASVEMRMVSGKSAKEGCHRGSGAECILSLSKGLCGRSREECLRNPLLLPSLRRSSAIAMRAVRGSHGRVAVVTWVRPELISVGKLSKDTYI